MLQWMGGSRRKVAASRKSTQKRQKQYFEQRKRQQQQHYMTSLSENHGDGSNTCDQQQKENRSLDILGLIDASKIAEECKPFCSSVIMKSMPMISTDQRTPTKSLGAVRMGTSSNHPVETTYLERLQRAPNDTSQGRDNKLKYWENATSPHLEDLSVFDLIGDGDDGASGNGNGTPVHEAHVAFSVEGLGKLGTQTPVHSPQRPCRISYCGQSSKKAAGEVHSSDFFNDAPEQLGTEAGYLMQEGDISFRGKYLDSVSVSEATFGLPVCKKNSTLIDKDQVQLDGKNYEMSSFKDEDIFYDTQEKDANNWDASPHFPPDDFLNEEYSINWETGRSADIFEGGRNYKSSFSFDGSHLAERNHGKATNMFDVLDEYALCKDQTTREDFGFVTSFDSMNPTCKRHTKCQGHQSSWGYMMAEDARDHLSSLSEESCSSSAVWREGISKTPLARHNRRYGNDFCGKLKKSSAEDTCNTEMQPATKDLFGNEQEFKVCGKLRRSNLSLGKNAEFSDSGFNGELGPQHCWLNEDEFPSVTKQSHPGYFFQAPDEERHSTCQKVWEEDPFASPAFSEVNFNSKQHSRNSKHDAFGDASAEKFVPMSSGFFSDTYFEKNKHDVDKDDEINVAAPESSAEESVSKGIGNKSENLSSDHGKVLEKEINLGNNNVVFLGKEPMEDSDSVKNCTENEKGKPGEDVLEETTRRSTRNVDEKSLVVEIQGRCESNGIALCQRWIKDVDDESSRERKMAAHLHKVSVGPCQMITMESYMLQLWCVQNGKIFMQGASKKV